MSWTTTTMSWVYVVDDNYYVVGACHGRYLLCRGRQLLCRGCMSWTTTTMSWTTISMSWVHVVDDNYYVVDDSDYVVGTLIISWVTTLLVHCKIPLIILTCIYKSNDVLLQLVLGNRPRQMLELRSRPIPRRPRRGRCCPQLLERPTPAHGTPLLAPHTVGRGTPFAH